ncbi:MAG: LysR family transcriptional regulator, partial [Mailhella sp.]|nr:LysR family transcriptional regulator [Mailhella sp.]
MIESMHGDIIQWLRGFYYIAQTGSIRRAAELMNRTPSTLSYGLKSLEDELETVLFDREGNRLKITPEGEKLMEWTISTFDTLRGMKAELSARPGFLKGQVGFSAVLPLATHLVEATVRFHDANPLVRMDIRRGMVDGVLRDVAEGVSEFGVISTSSPPEQLDFEEV